MITIYLQFNCSKLLRYCHVSPAVRIGFQVLPSGATFGCYLQVLLSGATFRCYLQVLPSSATFRCYLQVLPSGATFRCYLQVLPSGATFRCYLQVLLSGATFRCYLQVLPSGATSTHKNYILFTSMIVFQISCRMLRFVCTQNWHVKFSIKSCKSIQ